VITVRQGQPDVTVNQKQPQITVRQAPPHITIEQQQPEIIVRLPEPDVNVQRSRPQVSVQMPQPRVNIVGQNSEGGNVEINRAQKPKVYYERAGQPQVTITQGQGEPRVHYEDMNGNAIQGDESSPSSTRSQSSNLQPDESAATRTSARDGSMNQTSSSAAVGTSVGKRPWNDDWAKIARTRASAGDNGTERGGRAQQIRVSKLLDMSLYNAKGEELGDVDQVVLNTDDNRRYLVLASGGFLGLFEDKVAIPLERVRYEQGRLVIRGLTEDDIKSMQDWQQQIPHRRVLTNDDTASLTYAQRS
jgi:sporulation protein YlmC with PRC-barrel domain